MVACMYEKLYMVVSVEHAGFSEIKVNTKYTKP